MATAAIPGPISKVQWDLDGDGAVEIESMPLQPQTFTFTQPRLYA